MAIENFDPGKPSRTNPLGDVSFGIEEAILQIKDYMAKLPPSREHSMVITKLDEPRLWLRSTRIY